MRRPVALAFAAFAATALLIAGIGGAPAQAGSPTPTPPMMGPIAAGSPRL